MPYSVVAACARETLVTYHNRHGVKTQKTSTWNITAVKASKLAMRLRNWKNVNCSVTKITLCRGKLQISVNRQYHLTSSVPVAAQSKAHMVLASSNTAIVGSNPARGMDVCLRRPESQMREMDSNNIYVKHG